MKKINYSNETERSAAIADNSDMFLVEDIIRPNEMYLLFSGEKPPGHIAKEPVDEEKAFMAEAIIQMSSEIDTLKQEIQILKGGI